MRALMLIPPGVSNDFCANDSASWVNGLCGFAFFDRFGESVLGAMYGAKKLIFDK